MDLICRSEGFSFYKDGETVIVMDNKTEKEFTLTLSPLYNMDMGTWTTVKMDGERYGINLRAKVLYDIHRKMGVGLPIFLWKNASMKIQSETFIEYSHNDYGNFEFEITEDKKLEVYYKTKDLFLEEHELCSGISIVTAFYSPLYFEVSHMNGVLLSISILNKQGVLG